MVHNLLKGLASFVESLEDVLGDVSLLRSSGPAEFIKVAVKPLIDLGVDGVVVVTDLLACLPLLHSLGLGGGTILVRAANVDGVVTHLTAESCINIT